jgi:hypothetical protein
MYTYPCSTHPWHHAWALTERPDQHSTLPQHRWPSGKHQDLRMQNLWARKVFGGFKKFVLYNLEKVCGRSRKFVVVEKFVLQL